MKFQAIKGVRDILPPESALWNRVEQTAREVFGTFGFGEILLPIFEETALFVRSVGIASDIVSKEMYVLEDEGGGEAHRARENVRNFLYSPGREDSARVLLGFSRAFVERVGSAVASGEIELSEASIQGLGAVKNGIYWFAKMVETPEAERNWKDINEYADMVRQSVRLVQIAQPISPRPEATASVVRAYIEHGMQVQPGNVKLYYMGPMFRRERPQKGRYRQFYQIGAEVLGTSDAPGIDAEVIEMLMTLFERLKLKGTILNINSIGDKNCRPAYVEKLRAELQKVREQLGADSQRRIETNPLRVLDSKLENEQAIIEKLPRIGENLCDDCRAHYAEVKRQLDLRGIRYQENWRLVRGLDYYMRTTFEITAPGLGSQNAVCGGGRYDGLVELLGGPATTKGIGFAIGTDRLILSLQEAGEGAITSGGPAGKAGGPDVYLAWFGAAAQAAAIGLAKRLRDAGFVVELPAVEMKFGKSLGLADRLKARHAVIIGDDELAAGVVTVKRLADGSQQKLAEIELIPYLRTAQPL
jgi:histidyl-tRNA synthetase